MTTPVRFSALGLGAAALVFALAPMAPGPFAPGPASAQSVTAAPPPPADLTLAQRRIAELETALRDANQVADELNRENFRLRLENERLKQALDTAQRAAQGSGGLPPAGPAPVIVATPAPTPTPATPTPVASPPPPPPAASPAAENAAFSAAMSLAPRDPAAAEAALRAFLQTYPNSPRAGEATYFLGRTQYVQRKWNTAAATFLDIVAKTPRAPRAPESMIWLGAALRAEGLETNNRATIKTGCDTLRDVRVRFPNAPNSVQQQVAQELAYVAPNGGRPVCATH